MRMKWNQILLAVCIVTFLCLSAPSLSGQTGGSIVGTVHDASGAVVPKATVTITNTETGVTLSTKTTSAGEYVFPVVSAGTYNVSFSAPGFSQLENRGVIVPLSKTVSVDAKLQVGAATTSVVVQEVGSEIETTTAQASTTIDQQTYDDLPIELTGSARSPTIVADLMPGTADNPSTGYGSTGPTGQMFSETINGGQAWGGQVIYDGIPMVSLSTGASDYRTQPIPVEALSEFTLVQNNFDPQYGRTPGGVLAYNTRSGTNTFHGQAYEYLRNNDLDAIGYFYPANTHEPPLKQNEFGVNVGGPVVIPHLFDGRNKFHFFAFYSGFRLAAGVSPSPTVIPTMAERQGDFTALVDSSGAQIPIYDPTTTTCNGAGVCTRQQYSYQGVLNKIPPNEISAAAAAYNKYLPTPNINTNAPPGSVNYVAPGVNDANEDRFGGRLDGNLSSKDLVHGFFSMGPDDTTNETNLFLPGLATYGAGTSNQYYGIVIAGYDHIFTPDLMMHLGASWQYYSSPSAPPYNDNLVNFGISGGLSGVTTPQIYFPPGASAITYPSTNGNGGSTEVQYNYVENGFLSWTKGRHTFELGAGFTREGENSSQKSTMVDFLNSKETAQPGVADSGDAYASLMAGWFDAWQYGDYLAKEDIRANYFDAFFDDTFKVTPRLTLNGGFRYEIPGSVSAVNNVYSNFDPTMPNPAANGIPGALAFAGSGQAPYCNCTHFVNTEYKLFQPRVGVAFMLDNKTVVHLGYGIFVSANGGGDYGPNGSNTNGFNAVLSPSTPIASPNNGITPAFTVASGYPSFTPPPFINAGFLAGQSLDWLPRNVGLPGVIQNYTLDIQRQLPHAWLLDIGYVGNTAHHLTTNLDNPEQLPLGDALKYGDSTLNSLLSSPAGLASGVTAPFASFNTLMGQNATVAQALRQFPQYTGLDVENQDNGVSNYNSLQAKLQHQFRNGFSVLGSYTWARQFSEDEIFIQPFGDGPQDAFNPHAEYSAADTQPPQVFVISYDYELPFGYKKKWLNHGIASAVLGGWAIAGIQNYESGIPQFELFANNTLPIFNSYLRPNYVPGQPLKAHWTGKFNPYTDFYINPNAFTQPPPDTFGNVSRNLSLRSFGYYNEDFSARKDVHIHESVRFQIRCDFFNAFNRTLFGTFSSDESDPGIASNFGMIPNQANPARSIQFSAKTYF